MAVATLTPSPATSPDGTEGRGLVAGLASPHPLVERLPAVLQDDEFCRRLVGALDEALAPAIGALDCLDTYLDPQLAPEDFVDWLAGWVGLVVDENWPEERRRQLVQEAVGLYRRRGTVEGLVRHVALYTGEEPEIEETGGCTWSSTAGSALPGRVQPRLVVRMAGGGAGGRAAVVRGIVAASRPAHVPFTVEETGARPAPPPGPRRGAAAPDAGPPGAPAPESPPPSEPDQDEEPET